MPVTIDYYMSLNSPWTYLGSAPFAEIAARHGATVNVKPCKFGPIFEQTGGLPLPKRSPQRRAYRMMELKRWREVRSAPINLEPKHFPCDDAAAVRLVIAARLLRHAASASHIAAAIWQELRRQLFGGGCGERCRISVQRNAGCEPSTARTTSSRVIRSAGRDSR